MILCCCRLLKTAPLAIESGTLPLSAYNFSVTIKRPWHVNTRIGSRVPNHPNGYGVDFRPLQGEVWELQKRFQAEWYEEGK